MFVTGDIHTFVAGDVRLNDDDKRALATEFVGGSISAPGLGEGGGGILPGADPNNPKTPEAIIDAAQGRPTPGSRAASSTTTGMGWRWPRRTTSAAR